ncbi:MAG TPA: tetratricopeptide repeat protein [Thermoanaerobaculaceae bacterium]|nr:tetratricopeptide repeat protein [Thermoanaerobaculaceae bacterium]
MTAAADKVSFRELLRQAAAAPPWEQEELVRRALAQYPDHPHFLLLLGDALLFSGEWERARAALDRALELLPENAHTMRAAVRLRLAIADSHFPGTQERARRTLEQLVAGTVLPPVEQLRAQLALVRLLGATGRLAEAEALLARAERRLTGTDAAIQDLAVAERFVLYLHQRRLSQARQLLRGLSACTNRYAWWAGVLGRLYFNVPDVEVQALVASVHIRELPAAHRPSALALHSAFAGEAWEEILAEHTRRYPSDSSAYLVGAWLARREGQPSWRRYLEAGAAAAPQGVWLSPVWAQEDP